MSYYYFTIRSFHLKKYQRYFPGQYIRIYLNTYRYFTWPSPTDLTNSLLVGLYIVLKFLACANNATVSFLTHITFCTRISISEFQISQSGATGSTDMHCTADSDFSFKLETHLPGKYPWCLEEGGLLGFFPGEYLQTP